MSVENREPHFEEVPKSSESGIVTHSREALSMQGLMRREAEVASIILCHERVAKADDIKRMGMTAGDGKILSMEFLCKSKTDPLADTQPAFEEGDDLRPEDTVYLYVDRSFEHPSYLNAERGRVSVPKQEKTVLLRIDSRGNIMEVESWND